MGASCSTFHEEERERSVAAVASPQPAQQLPNVHRKLSVSPPPLSGFQSLSGDRPPRSAKPIQVDVDDLYPSLSLEAHSLDMSDSKDDDTHCNPLQPDAPTVPVEGPNVALPVAPIRRQSVKRRVSLSPSSRQSSPTAFQSVVPDLPPDIRSWLQKHSVTAGPLSRKSSTASPLNRCSSSFGMPSSVRKTSLTAMDSRCSEVATPQSQRQRSVVIDETW
ncbi:Hypothetical protein, putative [Bodo saltans]|uniref:Uncharacterized protein n=1 Tax=Bodo saltans TaxID=75058 RepID=A0A0S4KGZ1_BODSA|nr:Hypothetical protein, putative [Bodo saltans]|eukprot:CUI14963.1 Hypothetical protein, putative [Bodo saltans]